MSFGFLSNYGNSCYMDCVLVALFLNKSEVIDRKILKRLPCLEPLQRELNEVAYHLRRGKDNNVQNLRRALSYYKLPQEFDSLGMQDPIELITFIFETLRVEICYCYSTITISNERDELVIKSENKKVLPIIPITLSSNDDVSYTLSLKFSEETVFDKPFRGIYTKKIDTYRYKSKFIVFCVNRLMGDRVNRTRVKFPETIGDLDLYAIIVFKHHHYTLYIEKDLEWYYYDDLKGVKRIGEYRDLLLSHPNPEKGGVMYFYN